MDRLTFPEWFKREYPLYEREGASRDTSLKAALRIAWETAERQSLSQEAVRDEVLELRRLVKVLADLAITESEIEQEFMHGPRVIFEKGRQIAVRDVLMARKALKREPNAAAPGHESPKDALCAEPAPAAPDVAEMVRRRLQTAVEHQLPSTGERVVCMVFTLTERDALLARLVPGASDD